MQQMESFKVNVEFLNKTIADGELMLGCQGEVYHIYINEEWHYTGSWVNDKSHLLKNGSVIRTNKKIKIKKTA